MINQVNVTNSQNVFGAAVPHSQNTSMHPLEIDPEAWKSDRAYEAFLSDEGDWEVRGCPQSGMIEYKTECREIARIFSYQEGENEEIEWIMCGELKDGSVFFFNGGCSFTGFDYGSGGVMTIAPHWENLFDNLVDQNIHDTTKNMNKENSPELTKTLSNLYGNTDELRSKLKEIFSAVQSDK